MAGSLSMMAGDITEKERMFVKTSILRTMGIAALIAVQLESFSSMIPQVMKMEI